MRELNWVIIVERVLKLAIPTLYIWLCMFYTLFHVWLNLLAEVLHFGDREFYKVRPPRSAHLILGRRFSQTASALTTRLCRVQTASWHFRRQTLRPLIAFGSRPTKSPFAWLAQDWWNATTIGDYWRLWNMPVHKV